MVRKTFVAIILIFAIGIAATCLVALRGRFYRQVDILDGPKRLVTISLDISPDTMGVTGTWYHAEAPEVRDADWSIHDRILQATYEVQRGVSYVTRSGAGVREFKGRRMLHAHTPWWFAMTMSLGVCAFIGFDWLRRRRYSRRQRNDVTENES